MPPVACGCTKSIETVSISALQKGVNRVLTEQDRGTLSTVDHCARQMPAHSAAMSVEENLDLNYRDENAIPSSHRQLTDGIADDRIEFSCAESEIPAGVDVIDVDALPDIDPHGSLAEERQSVTWFLNTMKYRRIILNM